VSVYWVITSPELRREDVVHRDRPLLDDGADLLAVAGLRHHGVVVDQPGDVLIPRRLGHKAIAVGGDRRRKAGAIAH
jgi:hypothetical protein